MDVRKLHEFHVTETLNKQIVNVVVVSQDLFFIYHIMIVGLRGHIKAVKFSGGPYPQNPIESSQ